MILPHIQTACGPLTGNTPNSANEGPDFVCYFNELHLSDFDVVPCMQLLQVRAYSNYIVQYCEQLSYIHACNSIHMYTYYRTCLFRGVLGFNDGEQGCVNGSVLFDSNCMY